MDRDVWDDRIGYADGEWITWSDVDRHETEAARRALYAKGDKASIEWFEALVSLARDYHLETGGHLNVYGEIGELFGAAVFGIRRHRMYAQGSDGKLGDDFVEIKTITPFKGNDMITVRKDANFSKLLIVRIDGKFTVSGRLIARRALPARGGNRIRIGWAATATLPHDMCAAAGPEVWDACS